MGSRDFVDREGQQQTSQLRLVHVGHILSKPNESPPALDSLSMALPKERRLHRELVLGGPTASPRGSGIDLHYNRSNCEFGLYRIGEEKSARGGS